MFESRQFSFKSSFQMSRISLNHTATNTWYSHFCFDRMLLPSVAISSTGSRLQPLLVSDLDSYLSHAGTFSFSSSMIPNVLAYTSVPGLIVDSSWSISSQILPAF